MNESPTETNISPSNVGTASSESSLEHKSLSKRISGIIRRVLAFAFWIYALLKVFVFDVDVVLAERFVPQHTWVLRYKLFILLGLLVVAFLSVKSKVVFKWISYIFAYPIILTMWELPYLVFRQRSWTFAFACLNPLISFFTSLKYNLVIISLLAISFALILFSPNGDVIWVAIITQLAIMALTYVYRFITIFRPSSIFQAYTKLFSWIPKNTRPHLFVLDATIKSLPLGQLDQRQLEQRNIRLQQSVLFNRLCLFAANKLRDYQNSGFTIASGILTTLALILLTITSFATINYGLFKIDSNLFEVSAPPSFFTFFYYSFNNLVFNQVREILPVSAISQTFSMIQIFFALLLVGLFVSVVLPVRHQRYTQELNETIETITQEGDAMEGFIRQEYNINTIEDAIIELDRVKAGLISFIYQISDGLKTKR